jgi:stress-induced-phosphoprotein 1
MIIPDFLNCGVQNLFRCGTPLRETLAILRRIRLAIPKMKRIWGSSALSKEGRDEELNRALMMEEEALDQIKKGKFTLDDLGMPEWKD